MMQTIGLDRSGVLLRGIVSLILGILILVWPQLSLGVFLLLFGVFALVDGVFSLFHAIGRAMNGQSWVLRLLTGLFGIGVGIVVFVWPGITAVVLVYIIAAWALATGIVEIVTAIEFRQQLTGEWLLAATGIISVLFGLLLFVNPAAGVLALAILIGIYFVILGILLLVLAFQLPSRSGAAQ